MEHWMIVYVLPLEVWMDIFCFPWISREKFGQLMDKIVNFKFAEHVQFYLHEWGRQKLGFLKIDKIGLCKHVNGKYYRLEYPQTPMPENIKSFDQIHINHFDAQTIEFLDKIRPLLTNLEIATSSMSPIGLDNTRIILTKLAPVLGGIKSVYCSDESAFPVVMELLFREDEKLAKLKMLDIGFFPDTVSEMERQENVAFIMNCLAQPDNAGPRLFKFLSLYGFYDQISKAIREQFLVAKTQRTLAVNFEVYSEDEQAAEFHLENDIGEVMHGKWTEIDGEESFQITRHPASWTTKETHEWIDGKTKEADYRCISIENPTTGSLDVAPQMDV